MKKRKVLVLEPFSLQHMEKMEQTLPADFEIKQIADANEEQIKAELEAAEIVIGQPPLHMLQKPEENCPKLKLIQMTWAGTDIYTRSELEFPKAQIALANASGAFGMIMSQFVVGMILSVMLNFKEYHNNQQQLRWESAGAVQSLDGAKVLIYGAGDIGRAVAKRLSGFDAYCIGVCKDTKRERPYFKKTCSLEESEKYLPEADVVVGCIPNLDETVGFMNKNRLLNMKQDSIIVNVGRGSFIDCLALNEVLELKHLRGAALDVTDPEPLPVEHPLWKNPKCIITPHISGASFKHLKETEDLLCQIVCENLLRYGRGEEILNKVF